MQLDWLQAARQQFQARKTITTVNKFKYSFYLLGEKKRYGTNKSCICHTNSMHKYKAQSVEAKLIYELTLRAGLASGWKMERELIALTSTPIGCASWGIACIISCKTNSKTFKK